MRSNRIFGAVVSVISIAMTSLQAFADIRITEYMYQGPDGEFVELTNIGGSAVDMTGWSFDDNSNQPGSVSLSAFGSVAPGESVIITEGNAETFRTAWNLGLGVKIIGGTAAVAGLGRNDAINIWNSSNVLVDRLQYGDQDFPGSIRTQNPSGWVCAEGAGANDPYKWFLSAVADAQGSFTSTGGAIGSPGSYTSVPCPNAPTIEDRDPLQQSSVLSLPSVAVTFSASVTGVVAGNLTVNGSAATSVSGSGAGPYVFTGYTAPASGSVAISLASGAIVSTVGSIPFAGANWTVSVGISIVINELHYHPADAAVGPTEDPERLQFVELFNNGASAVDLSGWTFSGVTYVFPAATSIAPGEYILVGADTAFLLSKIPSIPGGTQVFTLTSGNFSNSGENISLRDTSLNVIDSVTYADGGVWPSAADGGGPSLELINPSMPNQFAGAWRASIGMNGTPGQQNSRYVAQPAPIIDSPLHTPSIPAPSTPVTIRVQVIDDGIVPPAVTLNYRQDAASPGAYSTVSMLDDGQNGDGEADDSVYGAILPGLANSAQYDFFITASDGNSLSTHPLNHPSANAQCSSIGCDTDVIPDCVVCQTLLCKFSNETLPTDVPVYHILVRLSDKAVQEALVCNTSSTAFDPCKKEFDATFIDQNGNVFYNVTERYRGQSSITLFPKSYRVDFPSNNRLQSALGFPVRKLVLNGNQPTRQKLGFDIFRNAGAPASKSEFVRLRFTGINYDTTSIGSNGFNGYYACNETPDSDFLDSQNGLVVPNRGMTSDGNLYRGENTANFDWRGNDPAPYRVNMWGRNGYSKENNEEEDVWTDLIPLLDAMNNSPAANYAANVAALLNEDQCLRYFAVHNILGNKEGGIYRDTGDDYYLYFNPPGHPDGYDAQFITWDTDSVLIDSNTETIWRTGNQNNTIAAIRNFIRHNAFAPIFVKEISDQINSGSMTIANFNALIDSYPDGAFFTSGGSGSQPRTRQQFKDWYAARVAFINNEIIDNLTLTGIPSSPYTNANPVLNLSGQLNQAGTHNVTVNGVQATFSVFAGTWSHTYTLYPGINKITVKSFDRAGVEMQSITSTVLYEPPFANPGLRLTMPTRMVDSKTLTIRADILDALGGINWTNCNQLGTVSATRLSDGSNVPTSITVFETLNAGAGGGTPPADSIRFYNGVGSVSITLDQGAATPPGDILVTVTVGAMSASKIVEVLDGDEPGLFKNLSGTLSGADLTWGPGDGVIHLTGDVTVNGGNTLTILPGTLIMVDSGPVNNGVAINGTGGGRVSAPGTRSEPVFFFPTAGPSAMVLPQNAQNNDPSWRGIYLQDTGSSTFAFTILTGAGNAIVASHPRPPIIRTLNSHNLTMTDCIYADCPGMVTSALSGASGTYVYQRCLFSRVGIGGEWLGTGVNLTIEDTWFTRIGRAPEPNGVDGDILHVDRPGNTYNIRRCVMTDCGDDAIDHSTGAQPVIQSCIIYDLRDKVVSLDGSAGGTITMTNCLIFNAPGGIRCAGAPAILTNCTLGSNTNVNGQACTGSSIQKCILWTNSADTCCGAVDYTIVGNPSHLNCGVGNLSTNPLFVSTSCNYNLQAGSPALTAGPGGSKIGWLGFPFPTGGCVNNGDCNDGDVCTTDICNNGVCENTPIPGCCHFNGDCNDGNPCTVDQCVANACSFTPTDCSDNDACTVDSCDSGTGCQHAAVNCDDNNPCTIDTCDPQIGCVNTPVACPQGQSCNQTNGQCEAAPVTLTFRQDVNGYTGTQDTFLQEATPAVVNGALDRWEWDGSDPGTTNQRNIGLIRFDNIFGPGAGQIPAGATIQSATLTVVVVDASVAPAGSVHESLADWAEASANWSNFGGEPGVQGDETGVLVASAPIPLGTANINVTSSLQAWIGNPSANYGWLFIPNSTDGVEVHSSEAATITNRPLLSVTYTLPTCDDPGDCDDSDPCTDDACVNNLCENTQIDCDDNDDCTADTCENGNCVHTPINGCCESAAECDDGNACTSDTCVGGLCQNTPISCDDGDPCTEDTCDSVTGCMHTPTNCDDGNLCTIDSCDSVNGCEHDPVQCPIGQACNPANGQCEVAPQTVTFRDGLNGYAATADTFIRQTNVNQNNGSTPDLRWDTEESGANTPQYTLIRFDDIFGNQIGQIPPGAVITSATLGYTVGGDTNAIGDPGNLHECLVAWNEATVTYANFGGDSGVQSDEYAAPVVAVLTAATTSTFSVNVTSSLSAWAASPSSNLGWIVIPTNTNGVQVRSSDYATTPTERPTLTVTFTVPYECLGNGDCDDGQFCNGEETCVNNECVAGTDPCPGQVCDENNDVCVDCLVNGDCGPGQVCNPSTHECETIPLAPTVEAAGARYLAVTPAAGADPIALRVQSVSVACLPLYADAAGYLVETPVYQTPAAWGTVHVGDREILPSVTYEVHAETQSGLLSATAGSATTHDWGNVNNQNGIDIYDILCVLDGYSGNFDDCSLYADDLAGELADIHTPDRLVDLLDIASVLDAYSGLAYADADPCAGGGGRGGPSGPLGGQLATLSMSQRSGGVLADGTRIIDVYVQGAVDLRGYQLGFAVTGGQTGKLNVVSIEMDSTRADYAFGDLIGFTATDMSRHRMANALPTGGVEAVSRRYLATIRVRPGRKAYGVFNVTLRPDGQTYLIDSQSRSIEVGAMPSFPIKLVPPSPTPVDSDGIKPSGMGSVEPG